MHHVLDEDTDVCSLSSCCSTSLYVTIPRCLQFALQNSTIGRTVFEAYDTQSLSYWHVSPVAVLHDIL
jgi:hypothetical protein